MKPPILDLLSKKVSRSLNNYGPVQDKVRSYQKLHLFKIPLGMLASWKHG